jgi:hypothetical protein
MTLLSFILLSSTIATAAFVVGERLALKRRKIRRRLIIMGLQARMDDREQEARNNWN